MVVHGGEGAAIQSWAPPRACRGGAIPTHEILQAAEGPVATITLNRPGAQTAFTPRMLDALDRAFDPLLANDALRVGGAPARSPPLRRE